MQKHSLRTCVEDDVNLTKLSSETKKTGLSSSVPLLILSHVEVLCVCVCASACMCIYVCGRV